MPFHPNGFFLATILLGGGGGAPPGVPTSFAVVSRTDTAITVGWYALPAGVTARLQIQVDGGDWTSINDMSPVTSPTVVDNLNGVPLTADTAYDVRVRAESGSGNSDWVTLTVKYTRPAVPTGLATTTGGYGVVNLNWDNLSGSYPGNLYVNGVLQQAGLSGTSGSYNDTAGATSDYALSVVSAFSGLESAQCTAVSGTAGTGSPPVNTGAPTIEDYGGSGATLTDTGTWSGDPSSMSFTYQWQADGVDIPVATGIGISYGGPANYTCNVTATNAVGTGLGISNGIL